MSKSLQRWRIITGWEKVEYSLHLEGEGKKKKKIGFIYEENHKFSADDKM